MRQAKIEGKVPPFLRISIKKPSIFMRDFDNYYWLRIRLSTCLLYCFFCRSWICICHNFEFCCDTSTSKDFEKLSFFSDNATFVEDCVINSGYSCIRKLLKIFEISRDIFFRCKCRKTTFLWCSAEKWSLTSFERRITFSFSCTWILTIHTTTWSTSESRAHTASNATWTSLRSRSWDDCREICHKV